MTNLKIGDTVKVSENREEVSGTILGIEFNGDEEVLIEVEVDGVAQFYELCEVMHENGDTVQADEIANLLPNDEPREDQFRDDVEADADVLRSCGWGTDEDYEHNDIDSFGGGFDD